MHNQLDIYLSIYLSICLSVYQSIYIIYIIYDVYVFADEYVWWWLFSAIINLSRLVESRTYKWERLKNHVSFCWFTHSSSSSSSRSQSSSKFSRSVWAKREVSERTVQQESSIVYASTIPNQLLFLAWPGQTHPLWNTYSNHNSKHTDCDLGLYKLLVYFLFAETDVHHSYYHPHQQRNIIHTTTTIIIQGQYTNYALLTFDFSGLFQPPSNTGRLHPIICCEQSFTLWNTLVKAVISGELRKPFGIFPLN